MRKYNKKYSDNSMIISGILQSAKDMFNWKLKDHLSIDLHTEAIIKKYTAKNRYFHNIDHIIGMLKIVDDLFKNDSFSTYDILKMKVAIIYHDYIYVAGNDDNELNSSRYFQSCYPEKNKHISDVRRLIEATKDISYEGNTYKDGEKNTIFKTSKSFIFYADCSVLLSNKTYEELLTYEKQIFLEFQKTPYKKYKDGRIKFLSKFQLEHGKNNPVVFDNVQTLIDIVRSNKPRIGLYCGSFNPFHVGHMDIAQQAEKLFDKVIIAKGQNPSKDNQEFDYHWKMKLLYETIEYSSLTTELIEKLEEDYDVTLIRGIRNGADLDNESNQLRWMQELKPDIKHVLIIGDSKYSHISSTALRYVPIDRFII